MKIIALAVAGTILLSGCATELGNTRAAQHGADQVRMIAVQREARVQEAQAQAQMNAALVDALARVAEANPEQASSVSVALAVIGVRGADDSGSDAPTVTLQREQNVGLEYVKALAPTVGNLASGLGVAAINAGIQKNASDNNRQILLGDQAADRGIVEAVASLGSVAAAQTGVAVSGDYYDLEGEASVDNSAVTTTSQDTTTTTTTETTTQNTTQNTTETTTEVSLNTTLNYEGEKITLQELITSLNDAGASYSIDLNNDGIPDVSGDTDTTDVNTGVSCVPTFDGYQCTGE